MLPKQEDFNTAIMIVLLLTLSFNKFTTSWCYSFQYSANVHRSNTHLNSHAHSNSNVSKLTPKRERPRIPVLQYHNDWVCVNKPAGMTVHRSRQTPKNQLVLSTHLKRQLARKVYPVHRLDHRTSGAMLFAFDSETCGLLHKALTWNEESCSNNSYNNTMTSKKEYIALVRGDWMRKFGENEVVVVDKPLEVKGEMKEARTEFHLLASSPGSQSELYSPAACSLVLCIPKTGRTHQIRRHAYSIGFPVIGDYQHGDTKINKWWREKRGLSRLFLHCLSLDLPPLSKFDSTKSQENISCTAPLRTELIHVLQQGGMVDLWAKAKEKDPRLCMEPFDQTGGTFGRNYSKIKQ